MSDTASLPETDERTYLCVRPTEDALDAATVQTHVGRLHRLTNEDSSGLLSRLTSAHPTTIECLLLTDGDRLTYAFGVDVPDQHDTLKQILRTLLPATYEIEETTLENHPALSGATESDTAPRSVTAVEFYGRPERRRDWQTQLTPFVEFQTDDHASVPLATLAETMSNHDAPMVYQALIRPKPDWSSDASDRILDLKLGDDTVGAKFVNAVVGLPEPEDDDTLTPDQRNRLEELDARDTHRSFDVNARVVAHEDVMQDNTALRNELVATFDGVSRTSYEIAGRVATGREGEDILNALRNRSFKPPNYERLTTHIPWTANRSPGIVADASEVGNFCLLGGETLTTAGSRGLETTPQERTILPRPPAELLDQYHGDGLLLGTPLTQDGTPASESVRLPPELQSLHVGWFGKTGSGKSTSLINAMLTNHAATEGADILIDPKGDGMPEDYLRAHYAEYGTLENVLYFDCASLLPAFSFFDIRDELDAGVSRTTAVEDTVDHYIEILTGIMGRERFEQAVRSPDIIRYLLKAMFDPVNGQDAFSHREFHSALRQMHERQTAPAVSDSDLERMLAGVVANRARSFDEIMQGVANRVEKIPIDERLATVFNHVADEDGPAFDLADHLDDDTVIVFDTGGLRSESQRVLTLLILSNLWTALRRRARRSDEEDQPLVNVYIEEAASIAVSDLLQELLAQSRGFDCSLTLSMQFPAQLRAYGDDVYDEVLNNVSTFVTGNVPNDSRLAERLATEEMDAQTVGNRLRALERGQWLTSLPAPFGEPEPRPFLLESAPQPPGLGEEAGPVIDNPIRGFHTALNDAEAHTRDVAGLELDAPSVSTDVEDASVADTETTTAESTAGPRLDSALPHTNRMPRRVEYDKTLHALRCTGCDNRYDPDSTGMKRALSCCGSIDDVDRDDIPVCDVNLKLTPEERSISDWSDTQLLFLQAVYNAQQRRYDPIEYDLLYDSMLRLQEYTAIDSEAIKDLQDAGLLRHDTDYPHRLYSVTPDGRDAIGEHYRQGVDYGHGKGDLEESSQHVFAVEVGKRHLEAAYVENPASPVTEVVPYYDLDDQHRLDIAGLDSEGEIRVTVEVERVNNDVRRAVPEDFDKMAACDVEEAIWVVMSQSAGHDVLAALNEPLEGEPRVEKTYAETTPPQQFRIDTPGLTAMYPAGWLRDRPAHGFEDA